MFFDKFTVLTPSDIKSLGSLPNNFILISDGAISESFRKNAVIGNKWSYYNTAKGIWETWGDPFEWITEHSECQAFILVMHEN